jgi:hypothetical protein
MASFLEKLIEIDCGNGRRSLNQVAQSRRILLRREYFSAHGVPIGAGAERYTPQTLSRVSRLAFSLLRPPPKTLNTNHGAGRMPHKRPDCPSA